MISVVIPTYNRNRLLRRCLDGLASQSFREFEVIIVDDGSSDNTRAALRGVFRRLPSAMYVRQENKGHSCARNLGFSMARGNIIASIDDDCVPDKNWLENINNALERNGRVSAVCGPVFNGSCNRFSECYHIIAFSCWDRGRRRGFVCTAPSCNIAYRKEVLDGLSFQSDGKSLGYRDVIFNKRVSERGRILFEPSVRVFHHRWEKSTPSDIIKSQKRQCLGFRKEGYRLHGLPGRLLAELPFLWILFPRLPLLLARSARNRRLCAFARCLPLIISAELERSGSLLHRGA